MPKRKPAPLDARFLTMNQEGDITLVDRDQAETPLEFTTLGHVCDPAAMDRCPDELWAEWQEHERDFLEGLRNYRSEQMSWRRNYMASIGA